MYFIASPQYVRLFGHMFHPSNAHQDDEAISSLKLPIIPLLNPGSRVCPKHKTPLYKTPLLGGPNFDEFLRKSQESLRNSRGILRKSCVLWSMKCKQPQRCTGSEESPLEPKFTCKRLSPNPRDSQKALQAKGAKVAPGMPRLAQAANQKDIHIRLGNQESSYTWL